MIPRTAMYPGCSPAWLSYVTRAVAVRVLLTYPPPPSPAVSSSSSVAYPLVSAPLHLALSSALYSLPAPSARYPAPAPSLLTCEVPVSLCRLHDRVTVVFVAAILIFAAPVAPVVAPYPPLFLPHSPPPPPPPFLRLLHLLAPPNMPIPLALATDIPHKDKDVGNRTGWGGARW